MNSRKALTLIELMATLAIVSLLTTAAMVALTRAAASSSRETQDIERTWLPDHLRDALETDLLHATYCQATEEGFLLKTSAALRPDSMKLEHLPVVVEYRVRNLAGRSCLLRLQRSEEDDETLVKPFGELVCAGVAGISLETLSSAPDESGEWLEMSGTVIAAVSFEQDVPEAVYTYTFRKD